MKWSLFPIGSPAARAWSRLAWMVAAWLAALLLLTMAAGFRVGRIDPGVARMGSIAGHLVAFGAAWLLGMAATSLVITLGLMARKFVTPLLARFGQGCPVSDDEQYEAHQSLAGALLLLAAAWVGLQWLTIPLLSSRGLPFGVPLLAPAAADRLAWASAGLLAELLLAASWLVAGRGFRWWIARALTGLSWAAFLAALITGPNLLKGEPLEWAARIGHTSIPQAWLTAAPRVPGAWWPAVQAGMAAALLVTLFGVGRELLGAWRARKTVTPSRPIA